MDGAQEIVRPLETEVIEEATKALRLAKERSGVLIERQVALRKLDQIADPNKEFSGSEPADGNINARLYLFDGIVQDYGDVLGRNPRLTENLQTLRQRAIESVIGDYQMTVEGYDNLSFPDDPTQVASTEVERNMIEDAARLLGYKVTERDGKKVYEPQPRYQVGGDPNSVVSTRVNVGIKNLIEDYTTSEGIRRPVIRTIVAMTDKMATTFRTPAK